jgi:hypothetical protein
MAFEYVDIDHDYFGHPLERPTATLIEENLRTVLRERQGAYFRLFGGAGSVGDARIVLDDLARFCRAFETPYNPDARLTDIAIGRGEVFRRILEYALLSNDELFHRYHERALREDR